MIALHILAAVIGALLLLATLRAGGYPSLRRRDLEQLVGSLRLWGHVRSSQPENLPAIF